MLCIDGCRFHFSYQGERYCDLEHAFLSSATVGCGFGQPYDPDDLDEPIKRTNYDFIISKTPDELAKFIEFVSAGCDYMFPDCPAHDSCKRVCDQNDACRKGWLDWLKQEADE